MQKESNGKSVAFFVICMPQSPKYRRRKCIPSLRCSNSVDNGGTFGCKHEPCFDYEWKKGMVRTQFIVSLKYLKMFYYEQKHPK